MTKIHLLSTYILPKHETMESRIDNVIPGSDQLAMMESSLSSHGASVQQHVITSSEVAIEKASVHKVDRVSWSELTLEILRLQRNFFLQSAQENTNWIVCDPDFLFFRNPDFVFDDDFDVAITVRQHSLMPYNSGIFFIRNHGGSAARFFDAQIETIEHHFMSNAQWFGDQLVLRFIIENAEMIPHEDIFLFNGLRIKLLDARQFNFSPAKEHPNLLRPPDVIAYHFKGRCRVYMKYFYRYYVARDGLPRFWRVSRFLDFWKLKLERSRLKPIYRAAVGRQRPNEET